MKKKTLIEIGFLIAVCVVVAMFLLNDDKKEVIAAGSKAPDFELVDVSGKMHNLSEYKGKPVVLNFFATWCEPCKEEAPELEKFGSYKGATLLIIARGESDKRMELYLKENLSKLTYLLDPQEIISDKYNVVGQPETFILDKDGIVQEKLVGPTTNTDLIRLIEKIN